MPVFVASDGTKFEDRNAWRRYEFETNYTFRNKSKETLTKAPGKIGGQPFDLSDLDQCEVLLLDQCDQVQVDNVTNSRVFIGPCSESVFVRNCADCVFTVACKQLRTRDCTNCTFYLYSLTDPIIETSTDIRFAPFNGAYNGIQQHFADARLEPTNNHWSQVYDFNDPDKSGRNWRLLARGEEMAPWIIDAPEAAALGPCVNPVPRDAGFVQYEDTSSAMRSFSFQTSQKEAQRAVEVTCAHPAPACEAPEPALSLPLPPPPAPIQSLPVAASASLPPPPVVPSSGVTENQKVATVEAPELSSPPPACPESGSGATKTGTNGTEPTVDAAIEDATQRLHESVRLQPA